MPILALRRWRRQPVLFLRNYFFIYFTRVCYQAVKMSVIWNLCDGMSNFSFKIPNLIIFCCVSQCYILKIYLWLLLNFFLCLHLSVGSYFNLFDVGKRLEPSAGQYFTILFWLIFFINNDYFLFIALLTIFDLHFLYLVCFCVSIISNTRKFYTNLFRMSFHSCVQICVSQGGAMAGALFCWLLLLLCTLDGDAADADSDFRYIPHDGQSNEIFFHI